MRKIKNLRDVEAALARRTAQTTTGMLADMTLDRVQRLSQVAGSPHERLKVVHVAGTSGKTSTAYMTTHLLRRAGKKVGLTVSPGVIDIREWVQLSDELLSVEDFCTYFLEYLLLVEDIDFTPTRFEYLMVFALWAFDKAGVDYAVVETGLGGSVDASNICQQPDKVCVITDIGFDHVVVLGNTLDQIAAHKAGIIAPENIVVMYEQTREVMTVFREVAASKKAKLFEVQPRPHELFMRRNARLSYEAYKALAERDGLPVFTDEAAVDELSQLTIPGRLQSVRYRGTSVLLDGAHNQQKMTALAGTLKALQHEGCWSAVYAMKDDKDYESAVAEIAPLLKEVIVVPLTEVVGDMKIESVPTEELCMAFDRHGVAAEAASSAEEGLDRLIRQAEGPILVTGSLYAVAEIMKSGKVE